MTELGRHILPTLQQTVEAAETARRLAAELRNPGTASLRVGLGPDVESFVLQPLIVELGRRLPGFRVTLREGTAREGTAREVNEWLLRSDVDVGVTADPAALTERGNRWVLFADPVTVLIPDGHALAADGPIEVATIAGQLGVGGMHEDAPLERLRGRIAVEGGLPATPVHSGASVAAQLPRWLYRRRRRAAAEPGRRAVPQARQGGRLERSGGGEVAVECRDRGCARHRAEADPDMVGGDCGERRAP